MKGGRSDQMASPARCLSLKYALAIEQGGDYTSSHHMELQRESTRIARFALTYACARRGRVSLPA
jgi:hypothetical protein